jgi:CubicO group peptidase (beta-lactamase class C family)
MRLLRLLAISSLASFAAASALAAGTDLPAAKPDSVGMSTERLALLAPGMKALVDQGRLAGVVTMVARHGKVVEFDAAGKRDLASGAPMQKDSIFRIYSMSKPITGVAMMMLFEQGKWQLNDPVAKYVPEFANLKVYATDANNNMVLKDQVHPVTMRELMSHTGGFTYGFFSNTPVDKLQREADVLNVNNTLDEFIKRMAKLPLNAQPGTEWHYSVSVDIQGYIVQKLSGMPFEEFLEKRIFKPLGMVDTGFYVPKDKVGRLAEFYIYDKDGKLEPEHSGFNHDYSAKPAFPSGGGGLVSTATDYMRFCQMLLNGGELNGVRLLSPLTVELMRTNVRRRVWAGLRGLHRSCGGRRLLRQGFVLVGRRRRYLVLDRSGSGSDRGRHDSTSIRYWGDTGGHRARCTGFVPCPDVSSHHQIAIISLAGAPARAGAPHFPARRPLAPAL